MNLFDLYYLNYKRELPRNYGESVGKRGPGNYFKDGYEYDRASLRPWKLFQRWV